MKKKGWKQEGRKFLNKDMSCLGAVNWQVTYSPSHLSTIEEGKRWPAEADGEFSVNRAGSSHWFSRKADLRVIHTLRKEMDLFEEAFNRALAEAKEDNAKT